MSAELKQMPTCFVIQPFDNGPFDKRYDDVFVPAISEANLEAYRVDRDPSAFIPMDEVEKRIREADACLADISESNPNVWFELGFALAAGKPVVLVCLEKPDRRFPFDIQHRKIITYKTESARDFEDLKTKITDGLKAWIGKKGSLGKLEPAPIESLAETSVVAEVAELDFLERTALTTLARHFDGHGSTTTFFEIKSDMLGHEFKAEEVTVALGMLVKKKVIETVRGEDDSGYITSRYGITTAGMEWLISHTDLA